MHDIGKDSDNNDEIVAELKITLKKNGAIDVTGPVSDKVLAYGMLEYAKDALYEHNLPKSAAFKKNSNGFLNGIRNLKK